MNTAMTAQTSARNPGPQRTPVVRIEDQDWGYNPASENIQPCQICNNNVVSRLLCVNDHGLCQPCFSEITLSSRETKQCFYCRGSIAMPQARVQGDARFKEAIANAVFTCTEKDCSWKGHFPHLETHKQQHYGVAQPLSQSVPVSAPEDLPMFAARYALTCKGKIFGYLTVSPDRNPAHETLSNIWEVNFTEKPDTSPPFEEGESRSGVLTLMDKAHSCLCNNAPYYAVRGDEKNLLMTSKSDLTELTYQDNNMFLDLDLIAPASDYMDLGEDSVFDYNDSLAIGFLQTGESEADNTQRGADRTYISLPKRKPTEIYKPKRSSDIALQMLAEAHACPNMNMYLLMGANHERLLGRVCKSGEDSEEFAYASGIDALLSSEEVNAPFAMGGNYLTPQKDAQGRVTTVIQKDPPDDAHPCGYETHFNLSEDGRRWKSIRFIKTGRSDLVMEEDNNQ